ncbi:hypothetical protein BX600DRAFT_399731 [Xylariales sp. PMI_506]|nr:hypothetical protein BX600DRAFT_399731 [Xylariales sp. PMI_506]
MRVPQLLLANLGLFLGKTGRARANSSSFTPFLPPSYPLAVRNPYFSAWIPGDLVEDLPTSAPQFWFGNDLGWSIIGRVDGVAYNLFGVINSSEQSATVISGSFSAAHSIFTLAAGGAHFTLDFFSPFSFTDYTRQSFPFSYVTITVTPSNKTVPPLVQVYSDIDESWTGQDAGTEFSFSSASGLSAYQLSAATQKLYSESANEQALWGEAVFATSDTSATAQSGPPATVRDSFAANGTLSGAQPSWSIGNVVAFSFDFGSVTSEANVTYAIGFVREEAINYLGTGYSHYYRATYTDTLSAVSAFLDDYNDAFAEASAFELEIQEKGTGAGGQNYSDILSLSVVQTFGGIDLTIPGDTLDTDAPYIFIKEISSDGNANTIDIIVELIPFFYAFNVEYLRFMLTPVLDYLATGRWPLDYCIHDLGTHYPNATGHDDGVAESMPVEESGNLLIMAAVIQAVSGNTNWTATYSSLFEEYADYLVANGEFPTNQLSTNDGLGEFTNMTQLGVKAAIALAAYGNMTGNATYTEAGHAFASTIFTDGVGIATSTTTGEPYFTLTYGSDAYFMLFNLYPDKLLGLDVFPESAYKGQSDYYQTVRGPYGVALEGLVEWGKTDWQMWSAAVAGAETRQAMIDDAWAYVSDGLNTAPFADRYWSEGDDAGQSAAGFRARPVLGAHFAVWTLGNLTI